MKYLCELTYIAKLSFYIYYNTLTGSLKSSGLVKTATTLMTRLPFKAWLFAGSILKKILTV